jgi:hypothetical protein
VNESTLWRNISASSLNVRMFVLFAALCKVRLVLAEAKARERSTIKARQGTYPMYLRLDFGKKGLNLDKCVVFYTY